MPISAFPGDDGALRLGGRALADLVRDAARGEVRELAITIPLSDSRTIHTIENRAEVLDRAYTDGSVTLTARIGLRQLDQLRSAGARMTVQGEMAQSPREGWGRRDA
jgi:hypothetical protein